QGPFELAGLRFPHLHAPKKNTACKVLAVGAETEALEEAGVLDGEDFLARLCVPHFDGPTVAAAAGGEARAVGVETDADRAEGKPFDGKRLRARLRVPDLYYPTPDTGEAIALGAEADAGDNAVVPRKGKGAVLPACVRVPQFHRPVIRSA